jgi:hypothetical protein
VASSKPDTAAYKASLEQLGAGVVLAALTATRLLRIPFSSKRYTCNGFAIRSNPKPQDLNW